MKKFLVERYIPDVGQQPREKLLKGVIKGTEILNDMGPDIQWVQSFVMDDRLYCVYMAKDEQTLREYVRRTGRPCNCVGEVISTLGPEMLDKETTP